MKPSPRPSIAKLAPYVPGRPIEEVEREYGISGAVKLASNENPLGPSPKGVAAAVAAASGVNFYPDGSATYLRRALSSRFGFPAEQVVVGSGSSELIDLCMRAFVDPGDEVVVPQGIFRMFPVAVGRAGGTVVEVPTKPGYVPDLDALKRRIGPATKVVAIANPNNPTGAYVPRAELERFFEGLPDHVVAVVDEAYHEFAREVADYPNGLDELRKGRNVLVLRTFSKAYGLAGFRIGYGFTTPEIAAAIHKVREPFNTTAVAQVAAIAALDDDEHCERTVSLVRTERAFLATELARRQAVVNPSLGNFLLVELPVPFGPLEPEFARRGVILRPMGGWGFPLAFRVSVGTHEENLRFLAAFDDLLAAGKLGLSTAAVPVGAG
ncbi:MAG TPA: histidinol-phosphate transaminase [Thermoanaerobaculia bacterium]|nr:histidinol-phosphate transaminase [Thermoanaerobaculia bacterium]